MHLYTTTAYNAARPAALNSTMASKAPHPIQFASRLGIPVRISAITINGNPATLNPKYGDVDGYPRLHEFFYRNDIKYIYDPSTNQLTIQREGLGPDTQEVHEVCITLADPRQGEMLAEHVRQNKGILLGFTNGSQPCLLLQQSTPI